MNLDNQPEDACLAVCLRFERAARHIVQRDALGCLCLGMGYLHGQYMWEGEPSTHRNGRQQGVAVVADVAPFTVPPWLSHTGRTLA